MFIHEWIMDQYALIRMKDTVLGEYYVTSDDREARIRGNEKYDYLFLMGVSSSYESFVPIDSFITEENVTEALKSFPGQLIREKLKPASYLVNKKIQKIHRRASRRLEDAYK